MSETPARPELIYTKEEDDVVLICGTAMAKEIFEAVNKSLVVPLLTVLCRAIQSGEELEVWDPSHFGTVYQEGAVPFPHAIGKFYVGIAYEEIPYETGSG